MLYEFSTQARELMEMLVDDPENEAIKETLDFVLDNLDDEADTACRIIRQIKADREALKSQRDFFEKKIKACDNAEKFFRGQILGAMLRTNQRKIKTAENTISVSTRSRFVLDVDPNDLPDEFKKVTVEPRLKEIGDAMKQDDRGWGHFEETESLTMR